MRVLSPAGIRLRDFLAGPARTTVRSIEILLEHHRIATLVGGHSAAVRARLSWSRHLDGNQTSRQINSQSLPHQFRARSVLRLHGSFDFPGHRRRKGNAECRALPHSYYFVILSISILSNWPVLCHRRQRITRSRSSPLHYPSDYKNDGQPYQKTARELRIFRVREQMQQNARCQSEQAHRNKNADIAPIQFNPPENDNSS
jgi:hypothetical protein